MKKILINIVATSLLFIGLSAFNDKVSEEIKGWFLAGNNPEAYEIGIETDATRGGKVGFLKSTKTKIKGFGTIMQTFNPGEFIGKKVKLSGYIKSSEVVNWSGMWLRIDGERVPGKGPKMLGFDNMQKRAIKGTTDWTKYEIILDVPEESKSISYGVLLSGTGSVWLDDLQFEIVDKTTRSTGSKNELDLEKPTNTSFEESEN